MTPALPRDSGGLTNGGFQPPKTLPQEVLPCPAPVTTPAGCGETPIAPKATQVVPAGEPSPTLGLDQDWGEVVLRVPFTLLGRSRGMEIIPQGENGAGQ